MTEALWLKLLDMLPQIITAAGVIIAGWFSYRANQQSKQNSKQIIDQAVKIEEVHKDVNGKMEKLLEVSKAASHAEGMLEGEAMPQRITVGQDEVINVKLVEEEK